MVRNIQNVSITENSNQQKIEITTTEGRTYSAQSANINNLIYAEYYVSGGNKISYRFFVNSTNAGKLSIALTDYSQSEYIEIGTQKYFAIVHNVDLGGYPIFYAISKNAYYNSTDGKTWTEAVGDNLTLDLYE